MDRRLAAGMVVAAVLQVVGPAGAAAPQPIEVVLHITNFGMSSTGDLATAEAETTRIYADIGVRLSWQVGSVRAGVDNGALHLAVLLLSQPMAERKARDDRLSDATLGLAANITGRAYIFSDRIVMLALQQSQSANILLGRTIAHEVGHLLLPANCHSPTGIMRADIDLRRTALRFTTEQGDTIRRRLMAALLAEERGSHSRG